MEYLVAVVAFGAGLLLVYGANFLLADSEKAKRTRVRRRLDDETRERRLVEKAAAVQELYAMAADEDGGQPLAVGGRARLAMWLAESGLTIRPRRLGWLSLICAAPWALVLGVLAGRWIWAVPLSLLAAAVPFLYVGMVRRRRLEKLLSQLPDAFDLMARSMRAGQTFSQALQAVADEFDAPLADEFGYCYEQQDLGLSPEVAMRDLASRNGLLELRVFVLAVMIQRQTGGYLASLLETLAGVIRERYRIRGAIKALTAEGRMQAIILLALPPLMLGLLLLVNRPYAIRLFDYPSLLVGTGASMLCGAIWIRRIVRFDF